MSPRPLFPPVFGATVSHPLVDDFSMRAMRQQQRSAPPGLPIVQPLPLRNHPMWSGNNELGRETPFAPDANNRQTVLKMEEWGEPRAWTLCLGMNYDRSNPDSAFTAFTVLAEIQFGVGGTTQLVEVDWRQGASITLVANTIVVNAIYPFQEVAGASVPSDLILRANVSRGATTKPRPTRSFTRLLFDNASAAADFIAVPPFAKSVSIFPYSNVLSVTHFQFYTSVLVNQSMGTDASINQLGIPASQLVEDIDFTNQLVFAPRPLPIIEGTRSLQLVWTAAGLPTPPPNSFNYSVEYQLAL